MRRILWNKNKDILINYMDSDIYKSLKQKNMEEIRDKREKEGFNNPHEYLVFVNSITRRRKIESRYRMIKLYAFYEEYGFDTDPSKIIKFNRLTRTLRRK